MSKRLVFTLIVLLILGTLLVFVQNLDSPATPPQTPQPSPAQTQVPDPLAAIRGCDTRAIRVINWSDSGNGVEHLLLIKGKAKPNDPFLPTPVSFRRFLGEIEIPTIDQMTTSGDYVEFYNLYSEKNGPFAYQYLGAYSRPPVVDPSLCHEPQQDKSFDWQTYPITVTKAGGFSLLDSNTPFQVALYEGREVDSPTLSSLVLKYGRRSLDYFEVWDMSRYYNGSGNGYLRIGGDNQIYWDWLVGDYKWSQVDTGLAIPINREVILEVKNSANGNTLITRQRFFLWQDPTGKTYATMLDKSVLPTPKQIAATKIDLNILTGMLTINSSAASFVNGVTLTNNGQVRYSPAITRTKDSATIHFEVIPAGDTEVKFYFDYQQLPGDAPIVHRQTLPIPAKAVPFHDGETIVWGRNCPNDTFSRTKVVASYPAGTDVVLKGWSHVKEGFALLITAPGWGTSWVAPGDTNQWEVPWWLPKVDQCVDQIKPPTPNSVLP